MKKLVAIVPLLPPSIDGVGDYALNVARQLRQEFAVNTHFVVGDPTWQQAEDWQEFSADTLDDRTPQALLALLSQQPANAVVIVHYVTYGYATKGCPTWLIEGLEQWSVNRPGAKLITMFHEIYQSGPPWRRNFWVSPQQKQVATRLARLSDRCITSIQEYAHILKNFSSGDHAQVSTLPIFSSVGEPSNLTPLIERQRRLVIFGQAKNRAGAYQYSLPAIRQICQTLEIEEIWDLGPITGLSLSAIDTIPIREIGQQPAIVLCLFAYC